MNKIFISRRSLLKTVPTLLVGSAIAQSPLAHAAETTKDSRLSPVLLETQMLLFWFKNGFL
ncbi:hypothetical protein [Aristophania vespae]|uniref:hypothetical protein n=1 Tax=Aristophania vespae TaxID=2697033 RepID=UPI001F2275A3|nr:hypothetical protein [Aristophania vespae]